MASCSSASDSRVDAHDGPAAMGEGSGAPALARSQEQPTRSTAFHTASSFATTTTTTSSTNGSVGGASPQVRPGAPAPWVRANIEAMASRAAVEKAEAERRLAAAEAQLRAALEELYNRHRKRSDAYSAVFGARHPLCQHGDSCVANAVGSLCQSFLLAYGVRVGIGVLLRAFKLIRNKS
ncbi:unnamed protein product, partial [Closterium sp. Naga37s-1]